MNTKMKALWDSWGTLVVLAAVIFIVLPLSLDLFRLNLVGKYLTYAFVAVGLVLCWGYGGILSLGQGVFFGLGGYCMAMFLKLEASDPESTKIQSTPGIPDFMDWNQLTELPAFWEPFHSFGFTLFAVIAVPGVLAYVIGVAMFKRRVGGVYFSIMTQAIAAILSILIIGQQGYTGGVDAFRILDPGNDYADTTGLHERSVFPIFGGRRETATVSELTGAQLRTRAAIQCPSPRCSRAPRSPAWRARWRAGRRRSRRRCASGVRSGASPARSSRPAPRPVPAAVRHCERAAAAPRCRARWRPGAVRRRPPPRSR